MTPSPSQLILPPPRTLQVLLSMSGCHPLLLLHMGTVLLPSLHNWQGPPPHPPPRHHHHHPSEHGASTDPKSSFGFARACLRSPYPTAATTITTDHQVRQTLEGALDLRGQASAELPMRPFG